MIYRNNINRAIENSGVALGVFLQIASPENAEMLATVGFDFVVIDMEHGSFGIDSLAGLIRGVQVAGATPVVRLPDDSETGILKALDAGAVGVMIPRISNSEQARRAVNASYYAPIGIRGACPRIRATAHGLHDWEQHVKWSNQNVMVWPIIESVEGFANFEEIIGTPRLHAVNLGSFDLSQDMGLMGQFNHPEVERKIVGAMTMAKTKGLEIVTNLLETRTEDIKAAAERWINLGSRILIMGTDRKCLGLKLREFYSDVDSVRQKISKNLIMKE